MIKKQNIIMMIPVFIIMLLLSVSVANACMFPKTVSKMMEESDAIFSGEVISLQINEQAVFIEFSADKIWKGTTEKIIIIKASPKYYPFSKGHKYLIYAAILEDDTYPTVLISGCHRTTVIRPWIKRKYQYLIGLVDINRRGGDSVERDLKELGKPIKEYKIWNTLEKE